MFNFDFFLRRSADLLLTLKKNMNNLDWLNQLPNDPTSERDNLILTAIQNGLIKCCDWVPIAINDTNKHQAIFYVCDDAIRLELPDNYRFRIPVSATLAQQCADYLEASLLTAKISDLAYQQASLRTDSVILYPSADMATISKSKVWNERVEKNRSKHEGLFRDCGKAWILSNRLSNPQGAINYGFYDHSAAYTNPQGIKMWQTIGTKHNRFHTDYSQTLMLMKSTCEIDGRSIKVVDVMSSPDLSYLISYEGVLHYTRQPIK